MQPFKVILDHAQTRIVKDRLHTQITGKYQKDGYRDDRIDGWDQLGSLDSDSELNCWVEPITGKLLLRPLQLTRLWQETGTGNYARILIAALTMDNPGDWENRVSNNQSFKPVAMKDQDPAVSEEATTTATYDANRPFFVNPLFPSTVNSDSRPYFECGWGTFAAGVAVRLYISGAAQVYKAGVLVGSYSWSDGSGSGKQQKGNGDRVGFVLLPCQPNELIVYSTLGGGFSHVFTDLDPLEFENTITPAASFRFICVDMGTDVELAACTFASSGSILSIPTWFSAPPVTGDVETYTQYYSPPSYGTSGITFSLADIASPYGAFVPDDIENGCRIKPTLTGDGTNTGFLWSVSAQFAAESDTMADNELDVTDSVIALRISASMDPAQTEAQFTLRAPEALDPGGTRKLKTRENRAVKIEMGGIVIIDGVADAPGLDRSTDDDTTLLHFTVKSKWQLLRDYRFSDPVPFDGQSLEDAFNLIFDSSGLESIVDAEAGNIEISLSSRASSGEWAVVAEPRESGDEIVHKIFEQYISDWFLHDVLDGSQPKLKLCPPESLSEDAAITIFDDIELALAAHGDDITVAKNYVYRNFNTRKLPIECNQLFVHGREPSTGKRIIVKMEDQDSQDATLGLEDMPDNWTGNIRKAAIDAPGLRSESACSDAIQKIWKKTAYRQLRAEWDSDVLLKDDGTPLWIGDCVFLSSETAVEVGTYRIQSLEWEIYFEPETVGGVDQTDFIMRRAHYTGELIQDRADSRGLGRIDQFALELASLGGRWAPKGLPGMPGLQVGKTLAPSISFEQIDP